jgi:hypothetical protein
MSAKTQEELQIVEVMSEPWEIGFWSDFVLVRPVKPGTHPRPSPASSAISRAQRFSHNDYGLP